MGSTSDPVVSQQELEVAEILRDLTNLIQRINRRRRRTLRCDLVWGVKKRRSSCASRLNHSTCLNSSETNSDGVLQKSKAAALSPASPLCFDPSGGEETVTDTRVNSVPSSPCSRRYKKGKVQESIKDWKSTVGDLLEENMNLRQEVADVRNRYESLVSENSQLKEIKSKWKTTTTKKKKKTDQKSLLLSKEEEKQEEIVTLPPTVFQIERESSTTVRAQSLQFEHNNRIWNFSGFSTVGLPDLNAPLDDVNGFVTTEQQQQQQLQPSDVRKMEASKARKRRVEINRRKAAVSSSSSNGSSLFRRENRAVKDRF